MEPAQPLQPADPQPMPPATDAAIQPKRKAGGRPFQKGGDPRQSQNILAATTADAPEAFAVPAPKVEYPEEFLEAMRWVSKKKRDAGEPELLQVLRAWFRKDPLKFVQAMNQQEAGRASAGGAAGDVVHAGVVAWDGKGSCPTCHREADVLDEGVMRIEELERRILEAATDGIEEGGSDGL